MEIDQTNFSLAILYLPSHHNGVLALCYFFVLGTVRNNEKFVWDILAKNFIVEVKIAVVKLALTKEPV